MSLLKNFILTGLAALTPLFAVQAQSKDNGHLTSAEKTEAVAKKVEPVKQFDLTAYDFRKAYLTALGNSADDPDTDKVEEPALFLIIASDDPVYTKFIIDIAQTEKNFGRERLYIIISNKAEDSPNFVLFVANGKDLAGFNQNIIVDYDRPETYRYENVVIKKIRSDYDEHVAPYLASSINGNGG